MNRPQSGISKGVDASLIWLYLLLVGIGIMAIFCSYLPGRRSCSFEFFFF